MKEDKRKEKEIFISKNSNENFSNEISENQN
jgi:hypothetical protein